MEAKPAVAMATAVATPVAAQGTPVVAQAQATPVVAQATAVAVPMAPVSHQGPIVANNGTTGSWNNSLCSCCDDRCTCLAAFFCSCVVIPQLTERMTGMPGKCKKLCMILWGLCVVYLGLSVGHQVWGAMMWMDSDDEEEEEVEDEEEQRSWGGMGGGSPLGRPQQVASLVFWVAAIHLGIQVRRRIRQRDGIFEDRCTECLTVACCHGCVNSQMLRQLDIDGSNYQLCSTTGDGAPVGPSRV